MRRASPDGRYTLRVLGSPVVRGRDGQVLAGALTHRHRLALLAVLAQAGADGTRRDVIVALLWPERDGTSARNLLRVALHEVRRALGADAVPATGDALRLDPAHVDVDVWAFERALEAGALEEAVGLYTGPFLDGLHLDHAQEFDAWTARTREQLAGRYTHAVQALARQAAAGGDWAAAVGWWRQLAAQRPADSTVAQHLVEALAEAGDVAGALHAAHAHVARLRDEYAMGAPPALIARVQALHRAARHAPPPVPASSAPPDDRAGVVDAAPTAASAHPAPVPAPVVAGPSTGGAEPASSPVPSAPPRAPWRRRAMRVTVLGSAVAGLALVGWRLAARPAGDATADGPADVPASPPANVLAIAPFAVVGGAPPALADGLPALLTTTLDHGDLRVVPSAVVAAHLPTLARDDGTAGAVAAADAAAAETEQAIAARIARAVHAGAVLTGVVAPSAGGLAVRATLTDAAGGVLARVSAAGRATDLPALVDRLSLEVQRAAWGRQWRVPARSLAAVSTASSDALYDYVRGEAFVRAARWDSAAAALTRATDLDSNFALAQLRLAEVYRWTQQPDSGAALRAIRHAERVADRLPRREHALLTLRRLREQGDFAALDSARVLAARYPDDPEARYVLADVMYHARPAFGAEFTRAMVAAFDSAAALDPTSTRVYDHPVTLAFMAGDSVRFGRGVAAMMTTPGGVQGAIAGLRELADIRWGTPDAAYRLLTARLRPPARGFPYGTWSAYSRATLLAAAPRLDLAAAGLTGLRAAQRTSRQVRYTPAQAVAFLLGTGQFAAARPVLDSLWSADAVAPPVFLLIPVALGDAGPAWVAGAEARLASSRAWQATPEQRRTAWYWRGLLALAAGDAERAGVLLRRAVAPGEGPVPRTLAGAVQAGEGWVRLAAGDTVGALARLEAGLRAAGYEDQTLSRLVRPTTIVYVRLLARRPARRREAIDRLRAITDGSLDDPVWAAWWRELGDALAAEGDARGAAAARARYVALWARADRPAGRPEPGR